MLAPGTRPGSGRTIEELLGRPLDDLLVAITHRGQRTLVGVGVCNNGAGLRITHLDRIGNDLLQVPMVSAVVLDEMDHARVESGTRERIGD